jgi:non-specific serine/threonine protein kinase
MSQPGAVGLAMAARHNLPAAVNSFVGRDQELLETRRLFGATRLLTLTGTGGVGKTRLAVQLAATLLDTYPDGAWLVELAPVADPNNVARAVAGTLGVAERHGLPILPLVAEALHGQRVLLILDNCEHVLDASARLAGSLLRTCPDLHVLATSREPLSIDGEQVWRVPSLASPVPPDTPERVARSAAAQLFLERARAVEPGFALTSQTAPAVAQVCRRLDGMPLALELATARVALLSVEQIAARLDDRFRLLVGGHRTTPARQQTLLATMEWSHGLLDDSERVLFRRLAVFSGGWTLEAAEAACTGETLAAGDIVDLLAHLVDQSIVVVEPDSDGSRRYRLLETVRAYATERLAAASEVDELRDRHAAYFWTLAEKARPDLMVLRFEGWLDRLDREQDNFRAALDWLASRDRVEEGLRLATALAEFWYVRGYAAEGRERLEYLLGQWGQARNRTRQAALHGLNVLVTALNDYAAAYRVNEESRDICYELGDVPGAAWATINMGGCQHQLGHLAAARTLLDEGMMLCRREGIAIPPRGIMVRANVERDAGNFAAAHAWFELSLAKEAEAVSIRADILHQAGQLAFYEGNLGQARALQEESLTIRRELGQPAQIGYTLAWLARAVDALGDHAHAGALYAESVPLNRLTGGRWGQAVTLEGLAGMVASNHPADALRLAGAADGLRSEMGRPVPPAEQPIIERSLAPARRQLSSRQQAAAWAEGRALGADQALALGLRLIELGSAGPTLLTRREQEVAGLVARGLTNRQIAKELVFTESTAAKHIEHILDKLGLTSRTQIAAWAGERRLLEARSS